MKGRENDKRDEKGLKEHQIEVATEQESKKKKQQTVIKQHVQIRHRRAPAARRNGTNIHFNPLMHLIKQT